MKIATIKCETRCNQRFRERRIRDSEKFQRKKIAVTSVKLQEQKEMNLKDELNHLDDFRISCDCRKTCSDTMMISVV